VNSTTVNVLLIAIALILAASVIGAFQRYEIVGSSSAEFAYFYKSDRLTGRTWYIGSAGFQEVKQTP
jgi:hypothetical protein